MSADPVSTKNTTVLPLMVAVNEKETLGLTIDIVVLSKLKFAALVSSLEVRANSSRDSSFPDSMTS